MSPKRRNTSTTLHINPKEDHHLRMHRALHRVTLTSVCCVTLVFLCLYVQTTLRPSPWKPELVNPVCFTVQRAWGREKWCSAVYTGLVYHTWKLSSPSTILPVTHPFLGFPGLGVYVLAFLTQFVSYVAAGCRSCHITGKIKKKLCFWIVSGNADR